MAVSREKQEEIKKLLALGEKVSDVAKKLNLKEKTVKAFALKPQTLGVKRDISKYITEEKFGDICRVIDVYIKELTDETKLEEAKINQLASVIGMIIDKFSKSASESDNGKIEELIGSLKK